MAVHCVVAVPLCILDNAICGVYRSQDMFSACSRNVSV